MVKAATSLTRQIFATKGRAVPVVKRAGGQVAKYALADPGAAIVLGQIDEKEMAFPAILTTEQVDRVGDVVVAAGCQLDHYQANPVWLYGHGELTFPIGQARRGPGQPVAVRIEPGVRVIGRCWMLQRGRWAETAADIFHMIVDGVLNGVSIGFNNDPLFTRRLESGGNLFERWDLIENSLTPTPANGGAGVIRSYLSRGRIAGKRIHPLLRKSLEPLAEKAPAWSRGWTPPPAREASEPGDFDVASAQLSPASTEYDWVSRHVGVPVKELYLNGCGVSGARMGAFLTGLRHALSAYELADVRNLGRDSEVPPRYETIELNSKSRDAFLVDGLAFYRGAAKFAVGFDKGWGGLEVRVYTSYAQRDLNQKLLDDAWAWAKANNFLKGEAFTLEGQFIPATRETLDDLFLEPKNKDSLTRTVNLLNQKGTAFAARGAILTGPPGTGKTLSARIVRNIADATFIWVSSRDFWQSGAFGGIAHGFELARELAPSVLCLEDVDNWLDGHTVDLLKTEMDGMVRQGGVLTLVTTNFPERLPEALIDRPGRFHDVLHFGLPGADIRRAMLGKWLPGAPQAALERAVQGTEGDSGAHVYELAHFARTLEEHDGLGAAEAVEAALAKVAEQRELITSVQLEGSRHRPQFREGRVMAKSKSRSVPFVSESYRRMKLAEARRRKALEESGGTAGGYTAPVGDGSEEARRIKEAVVGVAEKHKEGAVDYHDFYLHPEKAAVHHSFGDAAEEEHVKRVKDDLEAIEGVKEVTQDAEAGPAGEGYEKVYSLKEGAVGAEPPSPETTPVDAGPEAAKALFALRVKHGKLIRKVAKTWPKRRKDALESCVQNKIPKIAEDHPEMPDDQRVAVAYSMCGESGKSLEGEEYDDKDAPDGDGDADDLANPMGPEDEGAQVPLGAECLQAMVQHIEEKLPLLDQPEVKAFYEKVMEEAAALGKKIYPDVDFGGEAAANPQGEEDTEEDLDRYQNPPGKGRRAPRVKEMPEDGAAPGAHFLSVVADAADHLHDVAQLDEKAFGSRHRRKSLVHARALDRVHGMLSKASGMETVEKPAVAAPPPPPAPETDKDDEGEAPPEEVVDEKMARELLAKVNGLDDSLGRISQGIYAATGKKV